MIILVSFLSFIFNIATSSIVKPVYGWMLQALVRWAESNGVFAHSIGDIETYTNNTGSEVL